ncbi:MAG TPA: flagellar hook-associated protein FlgK [Burkholderiales bacterium]|nr:flagellar hook-associated protein FlgK [Burkholderiales bacterium]
MASNILSIGQSALAAAQIGISTTGNNIANASTPGYSRETVLQTEATPQTFGFGSLGNGVNVTTIQRSYSNFIGTQVNATQASKSSMDSYYSQVQQIDNMLGDSTSGLSPAMQSFFAGVQTVSADPSSISSRQALLSNAQSMTSEFQSMGQQLVQINQGVNTQITNSVATINTIAGQIAQLNSTILSVQGGSASGQPPNDLMDQRDQLITQLNQQIKATVVQQDNGQYNVFIGNGQPLVMGQQATALTTVSSPTNPAETDVAYNSGGKSIVLNGNTLSGGQLGGLLEFRSQSLDPAQNSLGLTAIGLGTAFNNQQVLGQDLNGTLGTNLFTVGTPSVQSSTANTGTGNLTAQITNVSALTASDYQLSYNGTNYTMTPVSGGAATTFATFPQTIDGVTYNMSGTPAAGDSFLVRPTANGATGFGVAITDPAKIAAAAPIVTSAATDSPVMTSNSATNTGTGQISAASIGSNPVSPLTAPVTLTYSSASNTLSGFPATQAVSVTSNGTTTTFAAGTPVTYTSGATISFEGTSFSISGAPANNDSFNLTNGGTGQISSGSVSASYLSSPLTAPLTLTYASASNTLSGFPSAQAVTVTDNGASTTYAAGTPVVYTPGATVSFGGISFTINGTLVNNDTFTVGPNTGGVGDNRNALLMGNLQNANTLFGGTANFQGAYSQMVSSVAGKTNELNVTSTAEGATLTSMQNAQQSVSGVNLDEEASNLLQYQQAYQAAGKLMQVASQLFSVILNLGN